VHILRASYRFQMSQLREKWFSKTCGTIWVLDRAVLRYGIWGGKRVVVSKI
jgi:hypothetical protein